MSKLANIPLKISSEFRRADVVDALTAIVRQVDGLTEGGMAFKDNAASAAPTSSAVAYATGDWKWNVNPTVKGLPEASTSPLRLSALQTALLGLGLSYEVLPERENGKGVPRPYFVGS